MRSLKWWYDILCSVFDVLRSEARVMEGLRSLLIESPFIHDILKLNVQPSDSDYAVDIRSPAVYVSSRTNYHTVLCSFCTMIFHPSNNYSYLILLYTYLPHNNRKQYVCFPCSGSIIWRRTAGTPRGLRPCRSFCVPLSQESSGRFARISTTWWAPLSWTSFRDILVKLNQFYGNSTPKMNNIYTQ